MIQQIKKYKNLEEVLNSSLLSHQVLHIDLNYSIIGDEGASGLGSALANCINLSNLTLDLSGNEIGDEGTSGLVSGLANCINLSNLTLLLEQKQFICFEL
ncbi:oxalate/formate antiporter protein (macronuclear) [Tetrahymena thermophila SB210]|uniref:Oxalate/formate antiporter protein n=1 Tax=Tetrahymena thermophila (strain SB210) TaxID=312017 RepID=W7X0N3_TETTS|nr:oxalate/formate antiporter protein [Tetrahymena thermophila SB210]EWS72715.1 oxalate/formate antiporter protein [Tetrahymena thermophila SB210]|eukprot:XP_012654741.1 oxalate/formate antiporter protein [Tetrahymena thermophila SB210]